MDYFSQVEILMETKSVEGGVRIAVMFIKEEDIEIKEGKLEVHVASSSDRGWPQRRNDFPNRCARHMGEISSRQVENEGDNIWRRDAIKKGASPSC